MVLMFVYGSLRKKGHNHQFLENEEFLMKGFVKGTLFKLQEVPYPALLEGDGFIVGELYRVSENAESRIDFLEGFISENHPRNLYHKILVDVYNEQHQPVEKAYVYYFNPDFPNALHWTMTKVDTNDYFPED